VFVVESSGWASGVHDHFVAVAEYDFEAENHDELSFKHGTVLTVAPKGLPIDRCHTCNFLAQFCRTSYLARQNCKCDMVSHASF